MKTADRILMPKTTITPEQQLANVADLLIRSTEVKRPHNGRGKCATYADSVDVIAQTGRQLAEMIQKYLKGELEAVHVGQNLPEF